MTTAHRPTFDPARGRETLRGPAYHQRLLPAHTALKHRQAGQGGSGGLKDAPQREKRDLRAELQLAEKAAKKARKGGKVDEDAGDDTENTAKRKLELLEGDTSTEGREVETGEDGESKRRRLILEEAHDVDADSSSSSSDSEQDDEDEDGTKKERGDDKDEDSRSDSSSDSDSEDEEAMLQRELAKIKAERAAAKAAEDAKLAAEQQEQREEEIALGNPLLNKRDFSVKRRWDDDVVFKNQARGTEDKGAKDGRFVNDLLRSDFHRKFMSRYVR